MKYLQEFRDPNLAKNIIRQIETEAVPGVKYRLMEFCGGHTHAIFRYGIPDLLPNNIRLIHGPGCPVCVLPTSRIDAVIDLLRKHDVTLCTYADLLRVPTSDKNSLLKEKARGADVRPVYSTLDALAIAQAEPYRQVVFFAIGFETTTPATAYLLKEVKSKSINNFSVFCNHVLTPAALGAILNTDPGERQQINGIIGPSHVSTIIGSAAYERYATQHQLPIVIAGFEPLDVLQSILMLIRQINNKQYIVENEYTRSVNAQGNQIAQTLISETMETCESFEWRGLGFVPHSALQIKPAYAEYDAEMRFSMSIKQGREQKGCECPAVLRGTKLPTDCKLFATVCRPDNPLGACMVSSEGACAAYWSYGRQIKPVSKEACSA